MEINRSFVRGGRKFISVALCLVMMLTTFFIFDPSVLSELLPKASAWNFTSYATSTNGDKSGLTINTSAKTAVVNTSDGFAYFLNSINNESTSGNGEFQGYTITLNCDVFLQKSQTDLESITYSDGFYRENGTAWYGVLDGNGHCISNFRYHYDAKRDFTIGCFGLIKKMSGGEIKNLTVRNSHVYNYNQRSKKSYAGGALIGKISADSNSMFSSVSISNVTVTGAELNSGSKDGADSAIEVGGFVGYVEKKTTFSNCKLENSRVQYNNWGERDGGFVGKATAEVIIQNDTPTVSVDSSTVIYKDGSGDSDHAGLIGWTSGKTTIKNVIMDATVYSGETGGGFIGYIENAEANISNSTMRGKVVATNYSGGFIGNSSKNAVFNISNCTNNGAITGSKYVGGIIGKAEGKTLTVTGCVNSGTLTANNDFVGGIVGGIEGMTSSSFENCTNNGTITGKTWYVAGIVGRSNNDNPITFNKCKNTVSISSPSNRYIGGIVGYVKGKLYMNSTINTATISGAQFTAGLCAWVQDDGCEIRNCLNTGNVSGNGNSNVAGILSTIDSQASNPTWIINKTVNTGTIYGVSATGGILGYMGNTDDPGTVEISDCLNKGDIITTGNDAGGIVGNMYNHGSTTQHHKYTNLYNYGNVSSTSTGDTFLGGIVGKEYGFCEFSGCENYGNITESATSGGNVVGGIVGWIQDDTSSVQNCTNYGQISGRNNVGGIVGEFSTGSSSNLTITQCGNYGTLVAKNAGNTQIGGIMGRFSGNTIYISKCFNGNGTDGTIASSSSKGLYAGGIIGYGTTIYIADSYNNAPAVYGNTAGGLVGYRNTSAYIYNSYYATKTGVTNYVGTGTTGVNLTRCYNSNTIATGTTVISTLNTSGTVTGIGTIGNAFAYKQNVNQSYPVLSWQVNTITKNVGRSLIADLIADTAKSGFSGTGSAYSIKLDGVTKTYYPTYTKSVNGITIKYDSKTDTFTMDGTWTPTATSISFLSVAIPSTVQAYVSVYYIGGLAANATTYVSDGSTNYSVGRMASAHKSVAVTAGRSLEIKSNVTNGLPVKFDNYKFHASLDYVNNVSGSSEASADLHATYPDLGTPSKTGYNFLGWFDQRSGGTKITAGSTVVNSGTPSFSDVLDRDVDIYANWDPITYTIKYDGNGETSGATASSTHTYDEAKNLTSNGFKRELTVKFDYNYSGSTATTATAKSTFNGWLCDKDGKTYADGASVINLTTVDKDTVTMTAQWIAGSVTMPTPSRTGYKFDGWYTAAEDGTEVTGSTFTPDKNGITLYAHWTPITYTVSYNGNGATSGSTASSTHTYNEAKKLTPNGFKREYTVTFDYNYSGKTETTKAKSDFDLWYCAEDGNAYADGASVINLTSKDNATVTMVALWTDVTVDFPTPTRTGYDFSGWFTADGNKFDSSTKITQDITLYAEWSIKSYKVTFVNGSTVLQESDWEYGSEPTYSGDTPTKAPTAECEYVFSGWSPEITAVTGDVTYTAQFTEKAHAFKYTPVDKKYHKYVCASCGYETEKEAHHFETVEYSDKYVSTCTDCGKVIEAEKCDVKLPSGCKITYSIKPTVTPEYAIATIVAPMQKGDTYFVYWVDGEGNIVGTYRTYSFFITGDCNFTPKYVPLEQYTSARNDATSISRVTGGKYKDGAYTIYTEHSVSTTVGSITGHGVVYTTNSTYANEASLIVNSENVYVKDKKATSSATTLTGLLAVSDKEISLGDTVWARSYIIDANGNVKYGALEELAVSGTTASSEIGTLSCESFDLTAVNAEGDTPTDPTDDTPTEQSPIEKIMSILSKLVDFIKKILEFFKISEVIK